MNTRRAITATLVAAAAVPGAALTSAQPALAAPCAGVPTITGFPFNGRIEISPLNLRTGPGMDCPSIGKGFSTDTVKYYCWRLSDRGDSWTFIGIPAAQLFGWVYSGALVGGGSPTACPTGQQGPLGGTIGQQDPFGGTTAGMGGNPLANPASVGNYGPGTTAGNTGGMGGNPLANPAVAGNYGPGTTTGSMGGNPLTNPAVAGYDSDTASGGTTVSTPDRNGIRR